MRRICFHSSFWLILLLILTKEVRAFSVEDYCQLTIEISLASVDEARERLGAVTQHAVNAPAYFSQLQVIEEKYKRVRDQLYRKYGSTMQEYLDFMRRHQGAVESYLQSHEEIRAQIDALTSQAAGLAQQHESAVVSAGLHQATPFNWQLRR